MALKIYKDGKEIEKYKIPAASTLPVWEIEAAKNPPLYEPPGEQETDDFVLSTMNERAE